MDLIELLGISIGLSMDAFAVSVSKGLSMKKIIIKKALLIALYFGFFHFIFPIVGYYLGSAFSAIIQKVDHWVAFILLSAIGIKMIADSFDSKEKVDDKVDIKTMLLLGLATSVDVLTVGITFAFLKVNIFISSLIIGIVVFIISFMGVIIGNKFGDKLNNKAEILGGTILILIGLKILLEHLGFLVL